jgi:hypothetical protein
MNANHPAIFVLRCAFLPAVAIGLTVAIVAACDSDNNNGGGGVDVSKLQFDLGGEVVGINDSHCADGDGGAAIKQATNPASCHPAGGGTATGNTDGGSVYGPTMYNNIGNDDDCKYLVRWTSTHIAEKQDVYFEITATTTVDNTAVTGAAPLAEVFLDDTHPAPKTATAQKPYEISPGTYVIGPVQFDAPGNWTVRFHLDEDCADTLPDSPHGHAAFLVGVP